MPEIINLNGGKVYFGSQFHTVYGLLALLLWAYGSTVYHGEVHGRGGLFNSRHRKQKRYRKGPGSQDFLQGYTPDNLTSFHEALSPRGSTTSQ
jgi:hypothetical protein